MAENLILPKRALGTTGIDVSILGLGTVKFGRNFQVKNKTPDGFELPSDAELANLISIASEAGLNLIDTAPAYGSSESRLGLLLKDTRNKFVLSTKVGEEFDGQTSNYDFTKKHITFSLDRSLQRLRTDRIEILLLHLPKNDLEILKNSDALEAITRIKESGKVFAIGASTHTVAGGEYALKYCDLLMLPFNPNYLEHVPLIESAAKQKKGILIKKGLLGGHLEDPDMLNKCFSEAYKFSAVSSLIAGTINPQHLQENISLSIKEK